jgi:phenylacetate-CoA ligase
VLSRSGTLDEMAVRVETRPEIHEESYRDLAALLKREVKNRIGVSIGVELLKEGTLPRSQGKLARIIDQRPER